MHQYLAAVLRSHGCETLIVGGCADNVHGLFALSRSHSIAQIVKEVKRTSSGVKTIERSYSKFSWQAGYGAFSVSQSHLEQVQRYIEDQEEHRRRTFQDEFRAFLKRYQIEFDERYVWN